MDQPTIQQAFDLAVQHHQAGRLAVAENLYRQVLARQPSHVEALHLLGVLAHQVGRNDIAVNLIRQAIALNPNWAEAYSNLGYVLRSNGQVDEAIAACRNAIAAKSGLAEAHCNLGAALKDKGQLDEAIGSYRQAIALKANYAEAHYNLANSLMDGGQLDEAISTYRQAVAIKPDYADAHNNLGAALSQQGHLEEAIAAYRKAIALKPDHAEIHSGLLVILNYCGLDAPAMAEELGRWNQWHAEPLKKFIRPHPNDRDPDRRLRVGYVSSDFHGHASAYFLAPLLEHHDVTQVELFGYGQVSRPDAMTRRLRQPFAEFRSTAGLSDEQVAGQIRADRIDILVDLKLHTDHNRLLVFARKPAPVQVTWLGYPGSTGLSTIDYRLSDPYLERPGMDESLYSERTLRLPDSFWCYDPLDGRAVPVNSLPALTNGLVTFGCLNNFCKINHAVLRLWANVLRAVPSSRLLLLAPQGTARQETLKVLEQEGVDGQRIEFVSRRPRRQYLELYHRIDLGLDSFPCGGHTTSLDGFWMGVPAVTLPGRTAMGRAGLSQLMNLKLPDLIAQTPEQYVQIATTLANDLPRLENLRSTLRRQMEQSPLMDAPRFAQNLEAAYREMWRKWCEKIGSQA